MEKNANSNDETRRPSENEMNRINDNLRHPENMDLTPDTTLPYPDPAIVNPEELATFPKKAKIANAEDVENESESRLVNRRSPVREGRNITRTDNNPDTDGFM
jgi:hypothetical protein